MGRLRARLARTEMDRDIQNHLADAMRDARKAQGLCVLAARGGNVKARRVARQIQQAIALMESVGTLAPAYDTEDPDMKPEADKRPGWFRPEVGVKSGSE